MTRNDRRRFLQHTLLAAAAAAAGPTSLALARTSEKGEKQSASPGEKLGVAMIGVHGQGRGHIAQYLQRNDVEILYVCDPDREVGQEQAKQIAKRQGRKPRFVTDLRKALDDQAVDFVSIATPNFWHALAAIWAMQAGKDVYVEKPVSYCLSEGRRMVETARKYGRICQTGTQCRTMTGTVDAIRWVHEGKIGEVKLARGLCYKERRPIGPKGVYEVPKSVDYNLYLGPSPEAPLTRPRFHYDWHWQSAYGNGDLGNQGIHQVDVARWGLGIDRLSDRVVAYGGRLGKGWDEDAGDTANSQVIVHEFGDKTLAFEVRNMASATLREVKMRGGVGVVFYGSDGYVVLDRYDHGVALDRDRNVVKEFKGGRYGDHFANFIKAVRSRRHEDLAADILEGHLSSALCHLGNISWRLGREAPLSDVRTWAETYRGNETALDTFERFSAYLKRNKVDPAAAKVSLGPTLSFDPIAETFTDNQQANAMLTREYRKPFVVPPAGQV